jgi:peptide/nickel transport system substrate-binding protein
MKWRKGITSTLVTAGLLALGATASQAETFRFSAAADVATLDPHAHTATSTTLLTRQIYEPLVMRGKNLERVPGLAESWEQVADDKWRLKLRADVSFHDGAPFTADDVVFSLMRSLDQNSQFRVLSDSIKDAVKIDDLTVEVTTHGPDPIFLDRLTGIYIMDAEWSAQHDVKTPPNIAENQESYTLLHANGTGPYRLVQREPGSLIRFARFEDWWGTQEGNVTEAEFRPIPSTPTRLASLLSGELDFVLDPAVQDVEQIDNREGFKVVTGAEARTMVFVMDVARDELLYSDVKGKNPFSDVRVRKALAQAIDIEALRTRIMRGLAEPTASLVHPSIAGYTPEADVRLPHDPEAAKELLREAGYPDGFSVTLDCPNNRYINDERVCLAVAAMWARIGVDARVNALPVSQFFSKVTQQDTSMYLMGWGTYTFDAHGALHPMVMTRDRDSGNGLWNHGGASNPQMDALLNQIAVETDQEKRLEMLGEALKLHNDEMMQIVLYHQVIPWAMRENVDVVHRADNQLELKWVTIN